MIRETNDEGLGESDIFVSSKLFLKINTVRYLRSIVVNKQRVRVEGERQEEGRRTTLH